MLARSNLLLPAPLVLLLLIIPSASPASESSTVHFARGLSEYAAGNWQDAHEHFDQAVEADANDLRALRYRGLAAARQGRWREAASDLERVFMAAPAYPGVAVDLGIIYFETGNAEQADAKLQAAYRQPDSRSRAALFLGLLRYRMGQAAEAERYLEEALGEPRTEPTARYYLALTRLREGQRQGARKLLGSLAESHPGTEVGRVAQDYLDGPPGLARPADRPWSVGARMGFEYDSNVVLAPDDEAIQASRGIGDEGDARVVLGAGGRYRLFDGDRFLAQGSYDFSQSIHFGISEFDLQGHEIRADLATGPGRLWRAGITGAYEIDLLNYQTFFQQGWGKPWFMLFEGDVGVSQIAYRLRGRDYFRRPFDPFLDSWMHSLIVDQVFYLGRPERTARLGYQLDLHDPVSDNGEELAYTGHQIALELGLPLTDRLDGSLAYRFRLEDYDDPNSRAVPPGSEAREDLENRIVVALERTFRERFALRLAYIGIFHDSNLDEFEYSRHVLSAVVRYEY